jgi:hypothetical protein
MHEFFSQLRIKPVEHESTLIAPHSDRIQIWSAFAPLAGHSRYTGTMALFMRRDSSRHPCGRYLRAVIRKILVFKSRADRKKIARKNRSRTGCFAVVLPVGARSTACSRDKRRAAIPSVTFGGGLQLREQSVRSGDECTPLRQQGAREPQRDEGLPDVALIEAASGRRALVAGATN